jgi:succinate dehydrogenase / fumarate reductase cytochrome b subunit
MTWKQVFTSSVGKKIVMALTGIFLITFLVVHVSINACVFADLFVNDDGAMFNKAAHFMGSTVLIRIMEVGLFGGILLHIIQGYLLTLENRSKRSVGYAVNYGNKGSRWYSRSMGLLGTLILIFLVLHLFHFWTPARFTHAGLEVPVVYNGVEMHNMFLLMKSTFVSPVAVGVYILGCLSLAWHLAHGFQSAFRTMGVYNKKYTTLLTTVGYGFSIIVPLVFILMPLAFHFSWIG